MHQPPNPADLRQVPPTTPECARIRGMLRCFADGDLTAVPRRQVELHVHDCRTCALALARAEFEVLRLRRAFLGNWTAVSPGQGFARRTVDRLLRESSELLDRSAADGGAPSGPRPGADLKRRVLAQVSADLASAGAAIGRPSRGGRLRRLSSGWLAASTVAAALAVLLVAAIWQGAVDFAAAVRLSVVRAEETYSEHGQDLKRVRDGDGFGDGAVLRVGRAGSVEAEFNDASTTGRQPAAKIHLDGDSRLRLDGGTPLLVHGTIGVTTERPMSVRLGDGTDVELGAGQYQIEVSEAHSFDDMVSAGLAHARVEVLRGEPATMMRDSGAVQVVAVGQAASYSRGLAGIALENQPLPPAAIGINGGPREPLDETEYPDLVGRILDDLGNPVDSAAVTVSFLDRASPSGGPQYLRTRHLLTDSLGNYELPPGSGIRGGFAVVEVVPPAGRADLSVRAPAMQALLRNPGGPGYAVQSIALPATRPLTGVVLGPTGQRLPYVRLIPVVYDELLGRMWRWRPEALYSSHNGLFELAQLPMALPPHQSLGVVAFQDDFDLVFQPVPLPGSDTAANTALEVRMRPRRTVSLVELAGHGTCEIVEQPLDLPPGAGMRRYTVQCGSHSATSVEIGHGRLWLVVGQPSQQQRLLALRVDGNNRVRIDGESSIEFDEVFRDVVDVAGVGDALALAFESRFDGFRAGGTDEVSLWTLDPEGMHAPSVALFALSPRSVGKRVRFLGFSGGESGIQTDLSANEVEILAVSSLPDGTSRQVEAGSLLQNGRYQPIQLQHPGQVQLGPQWRPTGRSSSLLRFEPLTNGPTGLRPALFRHVSIGTSWVAADLPAGQYRVTNDLGQTLHSLSVPAGGMVLTP
ncbi:MAG: zf-HC2 domain-containing protein [Planctomycetota bacterium]